LKKTFLKFFVGLVVIPTAVIALLWHSDRRGFFDLDHIEIVLNDAPSKSYHMKPLVESLDLSLETYRGKSLWSLELADISRSIGGLNWVKSHSISRSWPSGLTVKIEPQEVKALYLGKNNRLIPIISEGRFLDPIESMVAPDVVILDGDVFQARTELRRRAIEMLEEIPATGAFSKKTISEIRWDAKDGFRMKMVRGGLDVKMGEDQIALKSARVGQVLEYLANRGKTPKSLDANLSKKVLVKLHEPSSANSDIRSE
jgi:cell division protein FtsQ